MKGLHIPLLWWVGMKGVQRWYIIALRSLRGFSSAKLKHNSIHTNISLHIRVAGSTDVQGTLRRGVTWEDPFKNVKDVFVRGGGGLS